MTIWPIAVNTFRETVRDKILYNLLVFALALISVSVFLGRLTIGERMKVAVDVGLASVSIVGTLIAVFVGVGLHFHPVPNSSNGSLWFARVQARFHKVDL